MTTGTSTLLRRITTLAVVGLTAVGVAAFLTDPRHAHESQGPMLAQAQAVSSKKKSTEDVDQTALARCMDTWDRQTQMTKEEYRESCKRSIQENPELFTKPF